MASAPAPSRSSEAREIAVHRGGVQRGPPRGLTDVGVRARLEEDPGDVGLETAHRGVERGAGHPASAERVDLRSAFEQQPRRIGLAEERREVQGREPVARVRGRRGGLGVEDLSEPIDLAERRGLEHVERARPRPHDRHEVGIEPVQRTHQRRDAARVTGGGRGGIGVQDRLDPTDVPRLDRGEEIVRGACHPTLPR